MLKFLKTNCDILSSAYACHVLVQPMIPNAKAGQNVKFPGNMVTNFVKNVNFFTNFQTFLLENDRNIHLNDKFPLKIAKHFLLKQYFPGIRFPNSTFCPCIPNNPTISITVYPPDLAAATRATTVAATAAIGSNSNTAATLLP